MYVAIHLVFVCVCTTFIDVKRRWGTLQSAANEDAAMFLCKRTCFFFKYIYIYTYIVPPLGAYKTQLGGTYILSLLFYMVNVYCDYTSLYDYI